MSTSTIRPTTLDQFETDIIDWFDDVAKCPKVPVSFRRPEKHGRVSAEQLFFYPDPSVDVWLVTLEHCLMIQMKTKKLAVHLDLFVVNTAYEREQFCLSISPDLKPENRILDGVLRAAAGTKHPIFLSRAVRACQRLEKELPESRLREAASASSDWEVLIEALLSAEFTHRASEDPLAAAKLRGVKRKQGLLQESGGTFTSEEVASRLGISRQAVDKRRGASQLLALTQGKRGYSYPAFQFAEDRTLRGLEKVLPELKELDPWMQMIFFASKQDRLHGATPIEALQTGTVEEVVAAARGYGEQGAS